MMRRKSASDSSVERRTLAMIVGFAGREHVVDLRHAGVERALRAFEIGHQRGGLDARHLQRAARDVGGVGKLRR